MSNLSPGWYPDPHDPAKQIYWDGEKWAQAPVPDAAIESAEPNEDGLAPAQVKPKRKLWKIVVPVAAGVLVAAAAATWGGIWVNTPRNEALAEKTCTESVVDQMKSPATAKLAKTTTFDVTTKAGQKALKKPLGDAIGHASELEQLGEQIDMEKHFAGEKTWKPYTYVTVGAVDGENSYGANVRNYYVCAVRVDGTKVVQKPESAFFS